MAARLPRYIQKIFARLRIGGTSVGKFGSFHSGSPEYANNPEEAQEGSAWVQGWEDATNTNDAPALEDDNAINYTFSHQIAYLLQRGMPEWDAEEMYHENCYVSSGTTIYRSLTNNNLNNAVTDTSHWVPYGIGASSPADALTTREVNDLLNSFVYNSGSRTLTVTNQGGDSTTVDLEDATSRDPGALTGFADFLSGFTEPPTLAQSRFLGLGFQTIFAAESLAFTIPINAGLGSHTYIVRAFLGEKVGANYNPTKEIGRTSPITVSQAGRNELLAIFPDINVEAGSNILIEVAEDNENIINVPAISRASIISIAKYQNKEVKLLDIDFNADRIVAGSGRRHFGEGSTFNIPFKVTYLAKPVESFPKRIATIPENLKVNELVTIPEDYTSGRTPKRWNDVDFDSLTGFTELDNFTLPNIFTVYGNPSRYAADGSFNSNIQNLLRILLGAITKDCEYVENYFDPTGSLIYYKTSDLTDSDSNYVAPDTMPCRFTGDIDLVTDGLQARRITEVLFRGPYGTAQYYTFDDSGETSTSQPGNNLLAETFGYDQNITDTRFSDDSRTITAGIYRGTINGPERTELGADRLLFSPRRVDRLPLNVLLGDEFYLTQRDGAFEPGPYRIEFVNNANRAVLQSRQLAKEKIDQHINNARLTGSHLMTFDRVEGTTINIPLPEPEANRNTLSNSFDVSLYENLNYDSALDFTQNEVTYILEDSINKYDEIHIYAVSYNSMNNERDFLERQVIDVRDIINDGDTFKIAIENDGYAVFERVSSRVLVRRARSSSETIYISRINGIRPDSTTRINRIFNTRTQIQTGHFPTFNLSQDFTTFDEIRFHISDNHGFQNLYSFAVDDIDRPSTNFFAFFPVGDRSISLDNSDNTTFGILSTDVQASDNIYIEYIEGIVYNKGYITSELLSTEKPLIQTTTTTLDQSILDFDELYFRIRFPDGNHYWDIKGINVGDIANSIDNDDSNIVLNFGRDNFVNLDFTSPTEFQFSHEVGHGITTEILHEVTGVKYSGAISSLGVENISPPIIDRLPNLVVEGAEFLVGREYARDHEHKNFLDLTATDTTGFTAKTELVLSNNIWGNPSRFTEDSDVDTMVYLLIAAVEGCTFADDYFTAANSRLYYRVEDLTDVVSHFFAPNEAVCQRASQSRARPYPARRISDVVYRDSDGTAKHLTYDVPNDENASHQPGNNSVSQDFGYKTDLTDSRFNISTDIVPAEKHVGHGGVYRPKPYISDSPHIVDRLPSRARDGRVYFVPQPYSIGTTPRLFQDLSLTMLPGFSLAVASDSVWEGTIKSYSTDSDLRVVARAFIGSILDDCTFATSYASTATNNIFIREVNLGDRTADFESITVCGVTSSTASPGAARRIEEIIFEHENQVHFYRYDAENDDGSGPTSGYERILADPLITFGTQITTDRGYYRGEGRGIERIHFVNETERNILQTLSNLFPNDQPTNFVQGEFGPAITRASGGIPNRFDSSIVEIGLARNSGHSGLDNRIYLATDETDLLTKFDDTYVRVGGERFELETTSNRNAFTNLYHAKTTYAGRALNVNTVERVNAQDLTYEHVFLDLQSLGPHWVYSQKVD